MPRKDAERNVRIGCNVSTIEYDALHAHCRSIGVPVGTFLRESAFSVMGLEPVASADQVELPLEEKGRRSLLEPAAS